MKDETHGKRDTAPVAPETINRFLCFAIYPASPAMTNLCQTRLKPPGLTLPQYLVVLVLCEQDGLTVSGPGARVRPDSGTLSQLLNGRSRPALSAGSATRSMMNGAC